MRGRFDRLGDAYVKGEILVDGDAERRDRRRHPPGGAAGRPLSRLAGFAKLLRPLRFRHSRGNDARAIRHHYDAPTEFYAPWLDQSMTYSCAYFPTGEPRTSTPRRRPRSTISAPSCGCRRATAVLDIGCGWGGLMARAARLHGISGVGVTNSPAQAE